MIGFVRFLFVAFLISFVSLGPVGAHEARPLYVEVVEQAPVEFSVIWKVPATVSRSNMPAVSLGSLCVPASAAVGGGPIRKQSFRCDGDGAVVSVSFPQTNPSISTLIHVKRLSGEVHTEILSPGVMTWALPAPESFGTVSRDYVMLGVRHILEGYDHLLFVVCLLLLSGTFKRILITITGFTLAHSVTLAAAALGVVRIPVPPVEATIALSIVFVALELARNERETLTWRYPVAVSTSFGLLHGLGFAAVLTDVGLPQTEIAAALLFFNIGVEIGQVLFVAFVIGTLAALKGLFFRAQYLSLADSLRIGQVPAAYVVGGLGMFWTIERVSMFFA